MCTGTLSSSPPQPIPRAVARARAAGLAPHAAARATPLPLSPPGGRPVETTPPRRMEPPSGGGAAEGGAAAAPRREAEVSSCRCSLLAAALLVGSRCSGAHGPPAVLAGAPDRWGWGVRGVSRVEGGRGARGGGGNARGATRRAWAEKTPRWQTRNRLDALLEALLRGGEARVRRAAARALWVLSRGEVSPECGALFAPRPAPWRARAPANSLELADERACGRKGCRRRCVGPAPWRAHSPANERPGARGRARLWKERLPAALRGGPSRA